MFQVDLQLVSSGSESESSIPKDAVGQKTTSPRQSPALGDTVAADFKEPPDGGLLAWLQVLAAFFLCFSSTGLTVSFGVWQAYLKGEFLSDYSESAISWIGTVQGFLMVLVGIAIGPAFDLGYVRPLTAAGLVLTVLGFMMASIARQYYSTFLSLGVAVGLGGACLFTPSLAIVAQYFTTKRSTATGIAAAGGSTAAVLLPIAFRRLTATIGYGWANRIIGFAILAALLVSLAVLKPSAAPNRRLSLFDIKAATEPSYLLFAFGLFAVWTGVYQPTFYITVYARNNLQFSEDLSFYLLAFVGAGSLLGRILTNMLADYFGAFQLYLPVTFILGSLVFFWMGIKNTAGTIVFCILYGFFAGSSLSLTPVVVAAISPDLSIVGTRIGMAFSFASFGLLIGSPIGGALVRTPAGYTALRVFSGGSILAGFILFFSAWIYGKKRHGVAAAGSSPRNLVPPAC